MSRNLANRVRANQMRGAGSLPPIVASLELRKRFRFISSGAAANVGVTSTMIRQLLAVTEDVIVSKCHLLIDSFKLSQVTLMSIGAVGTTTTVALEWAGTAGSRSVRIEDTSLGVNAARAGSAPPSLSSAAFWISADAATPLFLVSGPAGTVVDLQIDLVLVDDLTRFAIATTVLLADSFNVKYLDGLIGGAAGILVPQGYRNTYPN